MWAAVGAGLNICPAVSALNFSATIAITVNAHCSPLCSLAGLLATDGLFAFSASLSTRCMLQAAQVELEDVFVALLHAALLLAATLSSSPRPE